MKKYYIHNGQKDEGPFNVEELKSKNIQRDSMIWYEGLDGWKKAGDLPELKELFPVTPPPLQIPTPLHKEVKEEPTVSSKPEVRSKPKNKKNLVIISVLLLIGLVFFYNYTQEQARASAQNILEESERAKQAEIDREKLIIRNNWSDYIKVGHGQYMVNELFGGISDLSVEVYNDTNYPIDEVQVAVDYIKSDGDKYKTEIVKLYTIPAHGKNSERAPDSDRGIRIKYKTISITSEALNFCYQASLRKKKSNDPYKCE